MNVLKNGSKKNTANNSRYTQLPGRGVANAVHLATFRVTRQLII